MPEAWCGEKNGGTPQKDAEGRLPVKRAYKNLMYESLESSGLLNILGNFLKFYMGILVTRDAFTPQILPISSFRMSETTFPMDSQLPETSKAPIPLPKPTEKCRREFE